MSATGPTPDQSNVTDGLYEEAHVSTTTPRTVDPRSIPTVDRETPGWLTPTASTPPTSTTGWFKFEVRSAETEPTRILRLLAGNQAIARVLAMREIEDGERARMTDG